MDGISRRSLLRLAFIGGLLALAGCAAPAPTATPTSPPAAAPTKAAPTPTKAPTATPTKMPLTRIVVAASSLTSMNRAVELVGKGKGYFLEEGLDIDWVTTGSGAKALAAVVGRSADIAMNETGDTISAVAQGQPAKVFALTVTGQSYFMVIQKKIAEERGVTPNMSLVEKGKVVKGLIFGSSSPGSGTDTIIRYFLVNAGLDPDRDVEVSYVGAAALGSSFAAGANDVLTSTQSDPFLFIRQGKAVMLVNFAAGDVPGIADVMGPAATAHPDTMKSRPEIFEAFTRGLWRAQKLIQQNPNEAREVVRKDAVPDMDRLSYEDHWNAASPGFAKSPEITQKAFQATLDFRNKTVEGPPLTAKFSDFYEPKFVEAARKQLGF